MGIKSKGKSGPKGGAKRHISRVKRTNQKQNKLVKKGKAKPNSRPRYIPNKKKGERTDNKYSEEKKEALEIWEKKKEVDREEALQELADEISPEDAQFIRQAKGKKRKLEPQHEESDAEGSDDEGVLKSLEHDALERIGKERQEEKKVRGLLPIKTRDGIKQRIEEVDGDEDEVEDMDQTMEAVDDDEVEEEADVNVDDSLIGLGNEVSVVELYAKRKELLQERKIQIGSLASNFLEAPQERIINLEKLVRLVDSDQPRVIEMTVHRLAAASVLEVLKDVTPGYKINHPELRSGEKLKKETLKLQKYENGLLKCYKNFLLKLEKYVNLFKKKSPSDVVQLGQAHFYLSCMCTLMTAHPHFNFCTNIIHCLTPILNNSDLKARTLVKSSLEELFKDDLRGEISFEAVKLLNHLVKSRKHNVKNEVVDVLLALRIKNVNLDKEKEEEIDAKKKESRKQKLLEKSKNSRQEKKRKKKLEALEKELLEARGEEGRKVKEKFFTETTKIVFLIYFRILKSLPKSSLMGSVLQGLAKFAHIINVEFFSDLVTVFRSLLSSGSLSHRDTLLCTGTVFSILSGQGESLNIDPSSFYQHLYSNLFSLSLTTQQSQELLPLSLGSLHDMLIKRRKKVSVGRVLAFTKRLSSLSLQLEHGPCLGVLSLLRQLHNTHTNTQQLLDSSHEVGTGVFQPEVVDPEHSHASNTTLWEHSLLQRHYHPVAPQLSSHILAGCPPSGEHSLSQDLKVSPPDLVSCFSSAQMAFNPPVAPPTKGKGKRGKSSPPSSEFTWESVMKEMET